MEKMYFSEKPVSPMKLDKVYILDNIQEEEPVFVDEDMMLSVPLWSADIVKILDYDEYQEYLAAEASEEMEVRFGEIYQALAEMAGE